MISQDQATLGTRIKSNVSFTGVPKGTEGVIDYEYGTGVMVAWDLEEQPLPLGYCVYDGKSATIQSGILRDGFGWDELKFLDLIGKEIVMDKKPMSYRQLRDMLNGLMDEQLNMSVTVANGPVNSSITDFFPILSLDMTSDAECDVLDDNHPVLIGDFNSI